MTEAECKQHPAVVSFVTGQSLPERCWRPFETTTKDTFSWFYGISEKLLEVPFTEYFPECWSHSCCGTPTWLYCFMPTWIPQTTRVWTDEALESLVQFYSATESLHRHLKVHTLNWSLPCFKPSETPEETRRRMIHLRVGRVKPGLDCWHWSIRRFN